jgi:hypothetical protein
MAISELAIPKFLYGTAWKKERTAAFWRWRCARAFGGSTPPINGGIILKQALDRGWQRLTGRGGEA